VEYIYEAKNGFYHKTYKYHIVIGVLITAVILFGALFISSSVKSHRLRTVNDRLTERLSNSEDTCRRLTETIGNCQSICRELDGISERNIRTAKDAIEIIEETRYYVESIEMELGLINSDSIYSGIDDWLESQGVTYETP